LLQHAHNPVDWYPWGDTALNLAKQLNKPILLSIGYSACHWCHVMAHESFENQATADLMNQLFINIKVDREERPDLDKIYQTAHQMLTQRGGGWPLTIILAPNDQHPFFSGTYFPPEPRYGMPPFREILQKLSKFYQDNQAQLEIENRTFADALAQYAMPFSDGEQADINIEPLNQARQRLADLFDETTGGFGGAPKFPHLSNIERAIHHHHLTLKQSEIDTDGLHIAVFSLKKMAMGGIYDHLGGGFCRYSVDEFWMIPHFEKMLYDNAQFLAIYSEVYQLIQSDESLITERELFKRTALETADWVLREMRAPEGGFYSSIDADSEGEEGKFYLWTPQQVETLLDYIEYPLFAYQFGLSQQANFEGQWHLHAYHDRPEVARKFESNLSEISTQLDSARDKLLQVRNTRVPPQRDEKILTAWNALMIKGLAKAGQIFARQDLVNAAEQALDFIKNQLWVAGRLLATYKSGRGHLNAYLDDYAFLLEATLTLLQIRWRDADLQFAVELAEVLLVEFMDDTNGGFYFTGHHHETLITRPKSYSDDSLPSGNGIAAFALSRLGYLLGEPRYLHASERTVKSGWSHILQMPDAHNIMLLAVEDLLFPPHIVILRGTSEQLVIWQAVCQREYSPQKMCFAIPQEAVLPEGLASKVVKGEIVAYVCHGTQCSAPLTTLAELSELLI
jgi:uncharacterized protein YyaL (SSP411 family)